LRGGGGGLFKIIQMGVFLFWVAEFIGDNLSKFNYLKSYGKVIMWAVTYEFKEYFSVILLNFICKYKIFILDLVSDL